MNLTLYRPKKDQCDVCVGRETQNVSDEVYTAHIKRKYDAKAEMNKDKGRAQENTKLKVLAGEVQSVLLCPSIQASAEEAKLAERLFVITH